MNNFFLSQAKKATLISIPLFFLLDLHYIENFQNFQNVKKFQHFQHIQKLTKIINLKN